MDKDKSEIKSNMHPALAFNHKAKLYHKVCIIDERFSVGAFSARIHSADTDEKMKKIERGIGFSYGDFFELMEYEE